MNISFSTGNFDCYIFKCLKMCVSPDEIPTTMFICVLRSCHQFDYHKPYIMAKNCANVGVMVRKILTVSLFNNTRVWYYDFEFGNQSIANLSNKIVLDLRSSPSTINSFPMLVVKNCFILNRWTNASMLYRSMQFFFFVF